MLKALDFYRTNLSRGLTPEKEVMFLPPNMVRKLDAVGIGNHTYLSITFGSYQEVVRYDHVEDFKQKHKKNIHNLLHGKESKIGFSKDKASTPPVARMSKKTKASKK